MIYTKQQVAQRWADACRANAVRGTPRAETTRCAPKRGRPCVRHGRVFCRAVVHRLVLQVDDPFRRVVECGAGETWDVALGTAIQMIAAIGPDNWNDPDPKVGEVPVEEVRRIKAEFESSNRDARVLGKFKEEPKQ